MLAGPGTRPVAPPVFVAGAPPRVLVRFEDWPVVWLWPLGLVFMQTTLARIGGFDLTIGVLVCHLIQLHLLMRYWLRRPGDGPLVLGLILVSYALVLGADAEQPGEFLRSAAYLINMVAMVLLCLSARVADRFEVQRSITVLLALGMLTALVVLGQALAFNLLHDLRWSALLGDFSPRRSPHSDLIYAPSVLAPVKRANGWFSEPSVAAWFMLFVAALALAARALRPLLATVAAATCLLAAAATFTLTGVLGATALLGAYLLFVRDRLACKALWLLIAGLGAVLLVPLLHQFDLFARFGEFSQPGKSVYFRVAAPLTLLSETLESHPLGYAIGQTDLIAEKAYYINWEGGSQTNIDNMLFNIVFHFGLLGILFNAGYLWSAFRRLVLLGSPPGLLMLAIILVMLATGAGWTHQSALLVGYAIVVGRTLAARRRPPSAPTPPPPALAPAGRASARAAPPPAPWSRSDAAP